MTFALSTPRPQGVSASRALVASSSHVARPVIPSRPRLVMVRAGKMTPILAIAILSPIFSSQPPVDPPISPSTPSHFPCSPRNPRLKSYLIYFESS